MNTLPDPVAATAKIPLLSGPRYEFAKALQKKASYFELALLFDPILVEHLRVKRASGHIDLDDCCPLFQGAKRGRGDMFQLFYSIPREVLEAVVLGTVAYDDAGTIRVAGSGGMSYSLDGCGVYVVGISLEGKSGAFLNGNELVKFVHNLTKYIAGCELWTQVKNNLNMAAPLSLQQQDKIDFVLEVENTYGTWDHKAEGSLRFCYKDKSFSRVKHLSRSFRDRAKEAMRLDPTGRTRTIQSPLYVGCSNNLKQRVDAYVPKTGNKSTFAKANDFYALTMSLLKMQGFNPIQRVVCAIRTWKQSQLSLAEMLVGALANCYVTQDGFNNKKTGQTAEISAGSVARAKDLVFVHKQFLKDNVKGSLVDVKARQKAHDQMRSLEPLTRREINREAETIENGASALCQSAADGVTQMGLLQDECDNMRELLEWIKAKTKQRKEEYELLGILTSESGVVACSDEESSQT
ncbi:hypothetical protein QR685DRAFT_542636 [Neurospora intermedia]|uniref:Uncharacterized protein n=1 Tax=Neurospora intermedia TaxID=5142 RepID=A0ABR3DF52_NEUIN